MKSHFLKPTIFTNLCPRTRHQLYRRLIELPNLGLAQCILTVIHSKFELYSRRDGFTQYQNPILTIDLPFRIKPRDEISRNVEIQPTIHMLQKMNDLINVRGTTFDHFYVQTIDFLHPAQLRTKKSTNGSLKNHYRPSRSLYIFSKRRLNTKYI